MGGGAVRCPSRLPSHGLFAVDPSVLSAIQHPPDTTIDALSSVRAIVKHGTECGNCHQDVGWAIQYAADVLALYAVRVKGRAEGSIALTGYEFSRWQRVLVRQVTGVSNSDPSPELLSVTEALAESWSADEYMAVWQAYERACERWKQSVD